MTSLPQLEIYRPYESRPSETSRSALNEHHQSSTHSSDQFLQPTFQGRPNMAGFPQQPNYAQEPPPPYVQIDSDSPDAVRGYRMYHQPGLFLPVVVPQTARAFRGSFYAPFIRAYAPSLAEHGISRSDFLTFIDGLNECWVANPALDGVGLAGTIMGQFHGLPVVQIVGASVEVAAGVSSAATSIARSKMYFRAMNANLFHPAGLHAKACSTKDMMAKIGHSEQELKLAPLDTAEDESPVSNAESGSSSVADDSCVRRMKALEGYVSPLDFNVPVTVAPSNFLKKMGHAQTEHMAKKHKKRETRKREEDAKAREKKASRADKETRKALERVEEAEEKLITEKGKMEQKLARYEDKPKEQERLSREFEKEEKKLQKEVERAQVKCDQELEKQSQKRAKAVAQPKDREEEATQKIQWVVVTRWFGDGGGDAASDGASSS